MEAVSRRSILIDTVKIEVQRCAAEAGEFHHRDLGPNEAWFVETIREAVVLGSRQDEGLIDRAKCQSENVEVTVRRSGGGIVHLVPGRHVWVDVTISSDHPQWTDDVVESAMWLGRVWVRALDRLEVDSSVYGDRLSGDELGRLICFASLGPGEVVDQSGAKLVGISQRRTRSTARFQCTVLTAWDPRRVLDLLVPGIDVPPTALDDLQRRVAVVERQRADIESAFEHALLAN